MLYFFRGPLRSYITSLWSLLTLRNQVFLKFPWIILTMPSIAASFELECSRAILFFLSAMIFSIIGPCPLKRLFDISFDLTYTVFQGHCSFSQDLLRLNRPGFFSFTFSFSSPCDRKSSVWKCSRPFFSSKSENVSLPWSSSCSPT